MRQSGKVIDGQRLTWAAMVAPTVVLLILVNIIPLFSAVNSAFHNSTLLNTGEFVGVQNFSEALADPAFWSAVRFTVIFVASGVFGGWIVGFALALTLRSTLFGKSAFRLLLLLPWVVPIVVSARSWNFLTASQSSLIPQLFTHLGWGDGLLLADPTTAAITVCVYKIWCTFPFMMVMAASALEAVDESVYEASVLDGAGRWQQLVWVVLPLVARPTYISWLLMGIFCVNDFPTIYLLTGGGPVGATTTVVVYAYQQMFQNLQLGQGVAIALIMTVVVALVAVVFYRQIRRAHV